MINLLKICTYILNFLVLCSIITFTILFYFQIKINFLSNFIIIISILAIFLKLIFWYLIRKPLEKISNDNESNLFLFRLGICIFTYITPSYYLLQKPNLVMSNYVILITLIIISALVFIGIVMEIYLFIFESKQSLSIYTKKNSK